MISACVPSTRVRSDVYTRSRVFEGGRTFFQTFSVIMSAEQGGEEAVAQLSSQVQATEERGSELEAPVLPISQPSPPQPRPSDDGDQVWCTVWGLFSEVVVLGRLWPSENTTFISLL